MDPRTNVEEGSTVDKQKKVKAMNSLPWRDVRSILVLLVLYFLQGVPMGICAAIPMVFQDANVSDSEQGTFSLASWPFSIKLLWAPVVDAVFFQIVGRRKSWILPSQIIIAWVLYGGSLYIDDLLDKTTGQGVDVTTITVLFFVLFFCCATQDVAVDGWALTMLSAENVGYASICNTIGQTLGNYAAYLLHAYELLTLPEAMRLWAYLFLLVTAMVLLFTHEKKPAENVVGNVKEAYAGMYRILKLSHVRSIVTVMLLVKAPFVIVEGLSTLRLQSAGMPKSSIATIGLVTAPVSLLLPMMIKPGKNVLSLFIKNYIPRLLLGIAFPILVYFAPTDWEEPMSTQVMVGRFSVHTKTKK